jgi:hypothetical protein
MDLEVIILKSLDGRVANNFASPDNPIRLLNIFGQPNL